MVRYFRNRFFVLHWGDGKLVSDEGFSIVCPHIADKIEIELKQKTYSPQGEALWVIYPDSEGRISSGYVVTDVTPSPEFVEFFKENYNESYAISIALKMFNEKDYSCRLLPNNNVRPGSFAAKFVRFFNTMQGFVTDQDYKDCEPLLVPYGSYVYGESHDRDYAAVLWRPGMPVPEGAIFASNFHDWDAEDVDIALGYPFSPHKGVHSQIYHNLCADYGKDIADAYNYNCDIYDAVAFCKYNVSIRLRIAMHEPDAFSLRKLVFAVFQLRCLEKTGKFINYKSGLLACAKEYFPEDVPFAEDLFINDHVDIEKARSFIKDLTSQNYDLKPLAVAKTTDGKKYIFRDGILHTYDKYASTVTLVPADNPGEIVSFETVHVLMCNGFWQGEVKGVESE